jgi:hypothetical protein
MRIKTIIVAALFLGGTSLALAQTPPTTGGQSPYPNNAGAAQEPGPGSGKSGMSGMSGKSAGKSAHHHHKKHHKSSSSKS